MSSYDLERQRIDLAAAFRWFARLGMAESVANHFSVAVSPAGTRFLVNPCRARRPDLEGVSAREHECARPERDMGRPNDARGIGDQPRIHLRDGERAIHAEMPRDPVAEANRCGRPDRHRQVNPGRTSGRGIACSRSEEHTSELQSPCNLVCRLLLEKKKKIKYPLHHKKPKKTHKTTKK